jgi:hypothetical protein
MAEISGGRSAGRDLEEDVDDHQDEDDENEGPSLADLEQLDEFSED